MCVKRTVIIKLSILAGIFLSASPVFLETNEEKAGGSGSGTYIDTHMHLHGAMGGPGMRSRRPGFMQGQKGSGYTKSAANLIRLMDQQGVARALIMPPPQSRGQRMAYQYKDLLDALRKYPDRLFLAAGGGILNPMIHETDPPAVTPNLKKRFRQEAETIVRAGAKSFGEMTALHVCMTERHHFLEAPPDHPLFLLLADVAAENNIPIDLHMDAVPHKKNTRRQLLNRCSKNPSYLQATIPPFERLLSHNRKTRIVWQHIGWDNTGDMTIALLKRLLKAHPNLYLSMKVVKMGIHSSGVPMPNRVVGKDMKMSREWISFIKEFPDRFMIGGDEFVGIPGRTRRMPQSFEEIWSAVNHLPPALAKKIGHDNAARVYNLK